MTTIAILQSNYIPWRGYFGILAASDYFVFLDSVQSTKNDWRNRNRIKTQHGASWLTIPVRHSNNLRIREVRVADSRWAQIHMRTIAQAYARAPHAAELSEGLNGLYHTASGLDYLSQINQLFIKWVAAYLGLKTQILSAAEILPECQMDELSATARLVEICRRLNAKNYLSGPAARVYLEEQQFAHNSIQVKYADYSALKPYPQLHGNFEGQVSVIDTLMMNGSASVDILL